MADVIREVLIRGKMEIIKADLAVPDITAFTKQLEAQNKLAQEQAAFLGQLIDQQQKREQQAKADDEANKQRAAENARIREEQRKAAEQARKEREEAKRQAAELAAAEKAAAEAAAAAEEQRRKEIDETNRARDEAIRKQREISDSLLKGGDALKTAGDGAFAFARGLTLIGLEGDANLEKVARSVASVQAKFDLFRGSVDIIKGGVESTRAFANAVQLAGGAVPLLVSRLAPLVTILGPGGAIAAGAVAIGAAVVFAFSQLREETESYVDRAERDMRLFADTAEREASRAASAFAREDAIRETLEGQSRIDAIGSDIAGLGARKSVADLTAPADKILDGFGLDLLGALSEEEARKRAEKLTQETAAGFTAELENEKRRQSLQRDLLSATVTRDQGADREREVAIRESQQREEQTRREIAAKQDALKRAEEEQAAIQRAQAVERAKLSTADRAFVDRTSQNIGGASVDDLQRLQQLAGASFGQDVTDELVRREGGTPASRRDEVAELTAELAALRETLAGRTGNTQRLVAEDASLDAQAEASASRIRSFLVDIAKTIETLENAQRDTERRIREATP